ncbi:hypothetical protein BTO06_02535 [Tenacibaculum sp. SZ-18]|nr:hypothetical protein BTO06_02535 [Tenacibaculum sp. SZ-18]
MINQLVRCFSLLQKQFIDSHWKQHLQLNLFRCTLFHEDTSKDTFLVFWSSFFSTVHLVILFKSKLGSGQQKWFHKLLFFEHENQKTRQLVW